MIAATPEIRETSVEEREREPSRDQEPAPGATLIETLTQLARRKWLIAKMTAAGLAAGAVLAIVLPVRYTAVARIMPPKQTQSTTSLLNTQLGMALGDASGGLGLKDPNAIYVGLLKSRPVADAIIARFALMRVYGARDMTAARRELEMNTQILSEKSTLISISVTDSDRKRAADMANSYTDQLRLLSKTISVTEASRRRLFFEDRLNTEKERLTSAQEAFRQVQQSKGMVHLDAQAGVAISSLAAVRGQIAAKEVELEALRSYSTDRNPDVQLAQSEIRTLEGEAAQMKGSGGSGELSDFGLHEVPEAGLDYLRAEREVAYHQAFFELLLKQYEAAELDEGKDAAVIQVVEPAIAPDRKSAPKRLLILLLSTFLGFLSGCVLARSLRWLEVARQDPRRSRALENLREALLGPAAGPSR